MRVGAILAAAAAACVATAACTIERGDVRTPSGEAPPADSVRVRRAVEATAVALQQGDFAALDTLYHDSVTVFEDGVAFHGWSAYRDQRVMPAYRAVTDLQVQLRHIDVHLSGGTAWVTCRYSLSGSQDGRPIANRGLSTLVLRRLGGRWRIVHVHDSTTPQGRKPERETPGDTT